MKFILIMLLWGNDYKAPVTVVTAEFDSVQACEDARKFTATNVANVGSKTGWMTVISQGCFAKAK